MRFSILMILTALAARGSMANPCKIAALECKFYFKGHPSDAPKYELKGTRDNGPGFTDAIALRDSHKTLISVNSNSPNLYLDHYGKWQTLDHLNKQLTPYQFKPFTEANSSGTRASRIGHETFQGDSLAAAECQCIKVTFTNWAYTTADGQTHNVNASDAYSCIVFQTGYGFPGGRALGSGEREGGNLRGSHKM